MTWAFSDESERAATMLFGVLLIEPGAVGEARKTLRELLLPGQRRVHTAKESARRRRLLLDAVSAIDAESVVFTLRRPPGLHSIEARQVLLDAASRRVIERGVVMWQLDQQEAQQAVRDRNVIETRIRAANRPIVYDHVSSPGEPLLWAIDAVLWAVGSGGDWRRRIEHRLTIVQLRP